MIIQSDDSNTLYKINRYEPGAIWVNQQPHTNSIVIRPEQLLSWAPKNLGELLAIHFEVLIPLPEILLLGTGQHLLIPPQALLTPLFQKGVGVEFMDSRAACLTFTALTAEARNVAACILIN